MLEFQNMKKLFSFLLTATLFLSAAQVAAAGGQSSCQIVYGGGEVCQEQIKFTINKLVQKPNDGYVENLNVNDPRYGANQNVNFKIVIENTGDKDIANLNVVDTFPSLLTFVSGAGTPNADGSQINFTVGKLQAGKIVEYVLTAKTAAADKLPTDKNITCVTNNVKATSTDGSVATDNSQVCIEKSGTPTTTTGTPQVFEKPNVKTVPATGPELAALLALIPTGLAGFYIRRKAN